MLSSLDFATFSRYSPKGGSKYAQKSRTLRGLLKNGNPVMTQNAFKIIKGIPELMTYFEGNPILVPVPRSSPIKEGALWPTKVITDELVKLGLGSGVSTCLKRIKSVPKSSFQTGADNRPSVLNHYESLQADFEFLDSNTMILVDDVLTLGRTTMACASRLSEAFPNAEIKVFALMRTRGFEDVNKLVEPRFGTMTFNKYSGKVQMPD
ncbi:hypothetical protein [Aquimarina macrocephali]|uniref:hypothetical protein n=1 Tax=Aquimarina macrocephali TaxID=666563 RepID=UPI0004672497|nr:hypothetical protein [Aquimarina macrocephali]